MHPQSEVIALGVANNLANTKPNAEFLCKLSAEAKFALIMPRRRQKSRNFEKIAEIAQLVEHNLAKVGVASSSLVFRSKVAQMVEW